MAYDFQAGTHQILYGSPSYLDDLSALTYAAWLQKDTNGGGDFGRIISKDEKKILLSFSVAVSNSFNGVVAASTTHEKVGVANSLPNAATTWVHVAFAWDGNFTTGASDLYKNGATSTPYSVSSAGAGPATSDAAGDFAVGNRSSGTLDRGFDGRLAELAVWNTALTSGEINSLAKGFRPSRVRPQSLVFYVRLIRNAEDIRNGSTPTVSGVAPAGYHPRVI